MSFDFLQNAFDIAHIPYSLNEPLANRSTFKIGSTADLFVKPLDISQFQSAIGGASAAEVPFFILGGGSNIVFPDDSYKGIIISTENLKVISMTDDDFELPENCKNQLQLEDKNFRLVTCQCGTPIQSFVNFCTKHNLSGAEQFSGLPGTIGGATFMNARCFDKSISELIFSTEHLEFTKKNSLKLVSLPFDESQWDYKKSPFQKTENSDQKFVTSVTFILTEEAPQQHELIESKCKEYINQRVSKGHFKYPSAGSVFKNNHLFGAPSGKLIDQAGLKGYTIGNAQIAEFHGNFIINLGNATQKDVKQLVLKAQETVKEKFSFLLEPEIIFVDN